jgi:uroporphyrinogen decarboxylase
MRPEQWKLFKAAAKRRNRGGPIPLALIVDSPWIPGYAGISHWDYFFDPESWLQANLRILRDFPDVIWFPGWWSEVGMGAEPSALGPRMRIYQRRIPDVEFLPSRLEDLVKMSRPDPRTDGFMSLCLYRYQKLKPRILDAGFTVPVVSARGPLTIASFARGVTQVIMDIVDEPDLALKFFDLTTDLAIGWLKAQIEVLGDGVEGILVLDDIAGFVGREHYLKFVHPFLKRMSDAFPADWVKVFHNDASVAACLDLLPETGFDVINWGAAPAAAEAGARLGGRMCLMGNVPPFDVGVRGTPEQVYASAMDVLRSTGDHPLILSFGGATTIGTPPDNIRALERAVNDFNRSH